MSALTDLQAAKAAVAYEEAAFLAAAPGPRPQISEAAEAGLKRGGLEAVIAGGECPACARKLVEHNMAIAERNRLSRVLADAKQAAGYDDAIDAAQKALADAEDEDLRAELGDLAPPLKGE